MKYVISIKNEAIAETNDLELAKKIAKMVYETKNSGLVWVEEKQDVTIVKGNFGCWGYDEI